MEDVWVDRWVNKIQTDLGICKQSILSFNLEDLCGKQKALYRIILSDNSLSIPQSYSKDKPRSEGHQLNHKHDQNIHVLP